MRGRKDASPTVRLIGNSALYTLGNLLPQMMNMLLLAIFTRYLSPAEFGIFSYTTAVCAFLAIVGHMSIHSYVLRHYFDCETEHDKRRLFGTIFGFLIMYNALLLGLEFLILPHLFRALDAQVPFEPYMRLALFNNVIGIIGVLPLTYFRVREQAAQFIALTLSQAILNGGLSFYLIVIVGTGILGRYYGVLGANLLLLVVYLTIISRVSTWAWDWRQIWKAIVFSAPLGAAGLLASVTTMADRLILERFVSLDRLGVYSVGFSIAYGLNALSNGIYKAIEPQVYRLAAGSRLDEQILLMKRYIVVLLVGLGAVMIAFSREILMILAAQSFQESYKILALLTTAVVLRGVVIPVSTYAVAVHKTQYVPLINLVGAGVSLGANFILIPFFGIYGATFSSIMASLVILGVYKSVTEHGSRVRWKFEFDLLFMTVAFALSALILQIETPVLILSLMVKGILVGGAVFLLTWRRADLIRPRMA